MKTLIAGTWGNKIALIRTRLVTEKLKQAFGDIPEMKDCRIREKVIDATDEQSLGQSPSKSLSPEFVYSKLHEAVTRGEVDFAVLGGEELPAADAPETKLVAILPRQDPADMLIFRKGEKRKHPKIVYASSLRRLGIISRRYPKASFINLKGNVAARLEKLEGGQCDALIYGATELKWLGLDGDPRFDYLRLKPEENCPAPCQGIIALEIRRDSPLAKHLEPLAWTSAQLGMDTERKLVELLGVDRDDGVGIYAEISMRRDLGQPKEYDNFMIRHKENAEQQNNGADQNAERYSLTGWPPEMLDLAKPYFYVRYCLKLGDGVVTGSEGGNCENAQETLSRLALTYLLKQSEKNRAVSPGFRYRFALLQQITQNAKETIMKSVKRLNGLMDKRHTIPQSFFNSLTPADFCPRGGYLSMVIDGNVDQFIFTTRAMAENETREFIKSECALMNYMYKRAIETGEDLFGPEKNPAPAREPKTFAEKRFHEIMMAFGAYRTDRHRATSALDLVVGISEEDARRRLETMKNKRS
ncbi:MAG: hypothetical protein IJ523_09435 [Succinivibrionaceae bacterium]|nr:hypothetical protein [Succinivibrionaceae bacterium]